MQTSQSGRVCTLVAVSGGYVKYALADDTAWSTPTNNTGETPPLNATGLVYSSDLGQKKYFVDGTNYAWFDPHLGTLEAWTATAGEMPVDGSGNTATIIMTYRGSLGLAGLLEDPQNYFFCAVDGPTDFDYGADPISTSAFAGHLGRQGLIGDVITGMMAYTDDVAIFFCDSTIKLMRGDPRAGGEFDLISNGIGAVFGEAFCQDPFGTIYFYSNKCGVYSMQPGQSPKRISRPIDPRLDDIDTGENNFRLVWNDRQQGLHVFVTPVDEPAPTTHYFYEARTQGWFEDKFENDDHNPFVSVTFDGNLPEDRVTLVGGWDGYVRALDPEAVRDDGYDIAAEVLIGPLTTNEMDDIRFDDFTAQLGTDSEEVTYEVYSAETAEEALADAEDETFEPSITGTLSAGRNYATEVRVAAHAHYLKLIGTVFSLESVRANLSVMGTVRQRGR